MTLEGVVIAFMAAITAVAIIVAATCAIVFVRWLIDEFGP